MEQVQLGYWDASAAQHTPTASLHKSNSEAALAFPKAYISFARDGTTFKGSSLDRSLSFSKIDKALTGGVNIDTGSQAQDPSVNESRLNDQNRSLTTYLSMLAADLAIGLIASGQEKKSEEQDLASNKKRGPRL